MLATYILKNARILQTMKIWSQMKQEQPEIERKLYHVSSSFSILLVVRLVSTQHATSVDLGV
jgi:hypothetical protein